MPFNLQIPREGNDGLIITLELGDCLYVLGANGTGKSSLMHRIYANHRGAARHISAHRQNWFTSSELTLSSHQKRQTETNIQQADIQPYARWKDDYSAARASMALYDLIDAENVRAREIASAVDANEIILARTLSAKDAPIAQINDLLRLSNIPVSIVVRAGEQLRALRAGHAEYGVSELSGWGTQRTSGRGQRTHRKAR